MTTQEPSQDNANFSPDVLEHLRAVLENEAESIDKQLLMACVTEIIRLRVLVGLMPGDSGDVARPDIPPNEADL